VADLAPLVGENRALVREGLLRLNEPKRLGLQALIAQAGLKPGRITSTTIAFVLGPRINAAGRLDHAISSYKLLTSRSQAEASSLARELEVKNRERQALQAEQLERAKEMVSEIGKEKRLFFLADEGFMAGIVGLVASRLCEEFYRPTVVVELGEEKSRGSCRSIPEFNITSALDCCSDLLLSYGGHTSAAGFTVENENLDSLKERLLKIAEKELSGLELAPTLTVDLEVELSDLNWATHDLLEGLRPFGCANPPPLLLSRCVAVRDGRAVGASGSHLKLTLSDGKEVWDAIAFGQGHWAGKLPRKLDIVYSLEVNEWEGEKRLQLNVKDLRPSLCRSRKG
jgi:single-stranded-DNA-specific exonuclease